MPTHSGRSNLMIEGNSEFEMKHRSARRSRYLAVDLLHVNLVRGEQSVLRDLKWRIRSGQRWALLGANGTGKTQLLKLIAGDVWPQPRPGTQRVYHWHGERSLEPLGVKEEIAYLGAERQDRYEHYGWNHRVATIVGTGLQRSDVPLRTLTTVERRQVARLLRRLQLESLGQRRFLTLSHGERRLVLLARALAWRPALLLLDEPLNGLDAQNRQRMLAVLGKLRRSSLPWIYATHRLEEVPAGVTHRAQLSAGRLRTGAWRGVRKPAQRVDGQRPKRNRARASMVRRAPLIELHSVWVWREGSAVLRRIALQIAVGDCWVVHGANGSGKSTLLATLLGEHGVASQGTIWRRGYPPGTELGDVQRRIGYVAPELQILLPRKMTAVETVVAGLRGAHVLDGAPANGERLAALRALRRVGALSLARRTLGELSYGQTRRVLFARAWARHPDILLLDEPYTGLDAPLRTRLRGLVETLASAGLTTVIASHHRDEWPRCVTHELELAGGEVRYCGVLRP